MNNDQYLVVSYFTVAALVSGVAVLTFLWLRQSFGGTADAAGDSRLATILKRLFCVGVLLPTLVGFFSVSFYSCDKDTYAKIVADRSYLVAKNQEQLSTSLTYIIAALMVWGVILVVPLAMSRARAKNGSEDPAPVRR